MKFLLFLLMFFITSALLIISNNELKMSEEGNFEKLGSLYLDWLDRMYLNAQTITGNVIRLEWLPD